MINELRPVLLVEDNRDDEELTIHGLERANLQNPIEVARDGQEALDYLFGTDEQAPGPVPAVVVLDVHLPRVGGLEVLRRIRTHERTRRIPVVILTSSREDQDLIDGYDLGANSYVCKPIQFDQFAAAVAQLGVYWLVINEQPPASQTGTPARRRLQTPPRITDSGFGPGLASCTARGARPASTSSRRTGSSIVSPRPWCA
jgi:two-component system, response regulator